MQRFLIAMVLLGALSAPALAQETGDDLLSGYKLGKFHATATLLAADLVYIDALVQELGIAEINDENYASGLISDEDVFSAQMGLAYTIWRAQFMLLPACEAGLEADAFSHPALAGFKDRAQAIITEVQRLTVEFVEAEGDDFSYLLGYNDALNEGGFVDSLIELAEEARLIAGDEE